MFFVHKHEDVNFTSNLLLFSILTELRFAWKSLSAEGLMLMNLGNGFLKLLFPPFVVYIYWEVLETIFAWKKNKKQKTLRLINKEIKPLLKKILFLRELSRKYRIATYSIPPCMHSFFIQNHPSEQYIC